MKVHRFSTCPSQKSWNSHTKIKPCCTKSQTVQPRSQVVPTLHTRHTPTANNKSPPDMKVPLPNSPKINPLLAGSQMEQMCLPPFPGVGSGCISFDQPKGGISNVRGPLRRKPQGPLQEVKGPGIRRHLGESQLGRAAQQTHASRKVMSWSFSYFLEQ